MTDDASGAAADDSEPADPPETDDSEPADPPETDDSEPADPPETDDSAPERVFLLGLDGVPWNLIEDWVDDGHLPNFARLFEEGASGVLESTTPAETALAWPTIATGAWPDQHGVYAFQRLGSDYTHQMNTSRHVATPALWDVLDPSVVANVPMTYPAPDVGGDFVTGMMTPQMDEGFTNSPALREEIQDGIPDYHIGLDWGEYADREGEFQAELDSLVDARDALRRRLQEREDWRLFFFVYTALDRLQHLVWDEDVLLEWYQRFDDVLGEVMAYAADQDALLAVASDHGFGPNDTVVSAARLLEQEGYLERRESSGVRGVLANMGVSKESVLSQLERVGVTQHMIVDHVPQSFVDVAAMQVPGEHSLYDVDHEHTAAFVHGAGNVYVNDTGRFDSGVVDPDDVPALKAELVELFENYTDPRNGDPVFHVDDGDELFPRDDGSPDLVLEGRGEYEVLAMLTDDVVHDADTRAAGHEPEGIFFAWGPSVEPTASTEDATVADVAPTLLHALGEPVPDHVDGRVLEEVFAPDSAAATRDVERTELDAAGESTARDEPADDDEDMSDVEDRLRGLGYIE